MLCNNRKIRDLKEGICEYHNLCNDFCISEIEDVFFLSLDVK